MTQVKAKLSDYGQSPRKTRRVADLVKGKSVSDAMDMLTFTVKRPSHPIKKLISSAAANAKNKGLSEDNLVVKDIRVDKATTLYRSQPASRGSAHPVRLRRSHVTVVLEEGRPNKRVRVKKEKPAEKTEKAEDSK